MSSVKFSEHKLKNGLDVILSEDASIPSVAINLCYHVGSKDEERTKRGFAHFFEHLMFEGSKNMPPGEYDKICVKAGGENNAYTNEDKTNYFVLMPTHQLELGLWMESDRMLGFAITEQAMITQKEVIREEKNQIFDNRPYGTLSLEFTPRLFPKSGYGWDTIGDMNDLEAASLDDVRDFYNKYYVPNNAVLTVVGDFQTEHALGLIEKYFGTIPAGAEIQKDDFVEEELNAEIREVIYDSVQSPGVFMGYRIPAENSPGYFDLDVLTDILSAGDSSRLYNELIYEKQLCSEVGCYVDGKECAGVFYVYAILIPGRKAEEAEREIDRIIEEVKSGGLMESEVLKVKNKMESRLTYKRQTVLSKADLLTHYKMFFNSPGLIDTNIDNYASITAGSVAEAARKYLNRNNRVTLHYLPKKSRKAKQQQS